jgi:hypothetical protein
LSKRAFSREEYRSKLEKLEGGTGQWTDRGNYLSLLGFSLRLGRRCLAPGPEVEEEGSLLLDVLSPESVFEPRTTDRKKNEQEK